MNINDIDRLAESRLKEILNSSSIEYFLDCGVEGSIVDGCLIEGSILRGAPGRYGASSADVGVIRLSDSAAREILRDFSAKAIEIPHNM